MDSHGGKSFKQHLSIPEESQSLNIKTLGQKYFNQSNPSRESKVDLIEKMSEKLPKFEFFGDYNNNQMTYLDSVELFMTASFEKEHRKEIVEKEILSKLKNFNNFLDIGIGKAELTKFIGQHFKTVTVIDNNEESLSNMPDYFGSKNTSVIKQLGSVLDLEIKESHYDLVLLSHTIYYIEERYRTSIFKTLYKSLNPDGIMSIIYNDGLSRAGLVTSFGGKSDELGGFLLDTLSNYNSKSYAIISIEIMNSINVEPMLHVAGLMLFDAGIKAKSDALSSYLMSNAYNGTHYQLEMNQNFIFVGASNDDHWD
jgi:2-polyprenyl-3-methyl-5-hydroxy-6-metoxy-1,4-benzoquinol methylase